MIALDALTNLELRSEGHSVDGYTVIDVDTVASDEHGDFASAVILTPDLEFYKIFFHFNFMFSDYEINGHEDGILAPKQVFPKTVSRVIYE